MKLKYMLFLLLLVVGVVFDLSGQVTIGDGETPLDVSVLEVISKDSSQPKGLRLPQLNADEVDILASYINQLPDAEKIRANGMMIFNTSISCTMVWNGKEFKSLCGDLAPAEMTPDCSSLRIFPNNGAPNYIPTDYQQGTPIDGANSYITLPVTVTKSGTYKVNATTGNGYSFSTDGTFLDVGSYILKLAGAGTPIMGNDSPQYHDQVTLNINGEDMTTDCNPATLPQIPVAPAIGKASFTIVCGSSTVNGTYIINSQLGSSHTITVQVNVTTPGFYSFVAEAGGMRFSRSGEWAAGVTGLQTVTLLSSGTPTQAGSVPITIKGETSAGEVTCDKNITVSYRAIKIAGFGVGVYQPASTTTVYSSRAIPASATNFGTTGTFPTQGISFVDGAYGRIANMISTQNPDIIVIGYAYHTTADDNTALVNFLNSGGVVLAFTEGGFVADAAMINAICGSSITVSGTGAGGSVYRFENVDNPLLNGPFGDIRNLYWGEDASVTSRVNNIPAGATALSASNTAFVYNNFVWVGDAGFLAGNSTDVSAVAFPSKFGTNGVPIAKPNYSQPVYNSVFYANALAWAIDYVQNNK